MSTDESTRCMVTKGGQPCALVDIGLGARKRLLMPGTKAPVAIFQHRRAARRQIIKARRLCSVLASTMLSDWPKLEPITNDTPWAILPTTLS